MSKVFENLLSKFWSTSFPKIGIRKIIRSLSKLPESVNVYSVIAIRNKIIKKITPIKLCENKSAILTNNTV